jgi:hypothetical protein
MTPQEAVLRDEKYVDTESYARYTFSANAAGSPANNL